MATFRPLNFRKIKDQEPQNGVIKRSRTIFTNQDLWSWSQTLRSTGDMYVTTPCYVTNYDCFNKILVWSWDDLGLWVRISSKIWFCQDSSRANNILFRVTRPFFLPPLPFFSAVLTELVESWLLRHAWSSLGGHTAVTGGNGVETRLTVDSVVSGESGM